MISMRICIILCSHFLAEGLARIIQDELGIDETVVCHDFRHIAALNPDLLIVDFNTLVSIHDTLSENGMKLLLIHTTCTPHLREDNLVGLISKGLAGILSPTATVSELRRVIEVISSGELWIDRKVISSIIGKIGCIQANRKVALTNREKEVVSLICKGFRNKDIMQALSISEQAVKSHLSRIYRKTGVCDRLQLALHAKEQWFWNS